MRGYRRGKRTHDDYNEDVVITMTAPEKATQQHCEWLRPRGVEGGITQVRANRLCTLVQVI